MTHSHRINNNLNPEKAITEIFLDKNEFKSTRRKNKKNEKIREILNTNNYSSLNISRKIDLLQDNIIRTKSKENKRSKAIKNKDKPLIKSGIFDNLNIKNYLDIKMDDKYRKNKLRINNMETKLNSLIKVNVQKRKEKYISSINNKSNKNKIFNDYKKRTKTEINTKNIYMANHENSSDNNIYNFLSQENFYSNKISEITLIQNFWRKYLSLRENIENKNYVNVSNNAKTKNFFIKIKKVVFSHLLKLLKYKLYNINYYIRYWHHKIYLEKILNAIISSKGQNYYKNVTIKIPNYSKYRKQNISRRLMSSSFNRTKKLNTYNDICSNMTNNLSTTNNCILKNNKKNNYTNKTSIFPPSNINSSRRTPMNNKSSEKESDKNQRNILITRINRKTKSNLSEIFFRNKKDNDLTPNSSANKDLKLFNNKKHNIKKKFDKILVTNNKTAFTSFDKDKINNKLKNKTLKTSSEKNRKLLQNKQKENNKFINKKIKNRVLFQKNENSNKNKTKIKDNANKIIPNKTSKNKLHKLKKFDTCPLSYMKKNEVNPIIYKSQIKKYFFYWKNITFKTKFVKYLASMWNKKKLRNILYRKIIRIIMDHFQMLILKKYFDEYQNKAIETNILLKLRTYLLKSNKLQKYIDSSEKGDLNHYNTKGGGIINNININNFINYNYSNQIISSEKNNNNWNNYITENNFKFPLSYMKNEINPNDQFKQEKNYKIVKINNFYPKGILINQMNQLRMVFNLLQQKKLKKSNIRDYFKLWKKNTFNNCSNITNFKKIKILEKKITFGRERNIFLNNRQISSTTKNNDIIKSNFQNNKYIRYINNINKNEFDNSSESTHIRNTVNNEIIYTKKILNHNKILSNNYYRYNNNVLKLGQGLRKINKIEEMEVHFNSLSVNKYNSFTRNTVNENSFNNSNKLTESAIKNKLQKIKVDFLENPIQKYKKENNTNYNSIFQNIKEYFSIINRKIDYNNININQTFCSRLKNIFDQI